MKKLAVEVWRKVFNYRKKDNREIREIPFDEVTHVSKYLEHFGTPYKKDSNIKSGEDFKKKVKKKLEPKQIKKLISRLNNSLKVSGDISSFKTIPFAIYTSLFTSLISVLIGIFTFYFNTFTAFSNIAVNIDKKHSIDPTELLDTIVKTGLTFGKYIVIFNGILLLILIGLWIWIVTKNLNYYGKLRTYKMLLEEAIEELETEEKKNKKTESVQIETQTKKNRKKRNKK